MPLRYSLAALLFFLAGSASAQDSTTWHAECQNDVCVSQISASETEGGTKLATVVFTAKAGNPTKSVLVTLPLGVALEPGIQIVADKQAFAVPFKVCLPAGCTARADLTPEMRKALETGTPFEVRFFNANEAGAKAVALPSTGLDAVFTRLDQ